MNAAIVLFHKPTQAANEGAFTAAIINTEAITRRHDDIERQGLFCVPEESCELELELMLADARVTIL